MQNETEADKRTDGADDLPVHEILGLFSRADQLDDSVKHLMSIALLLFLQHQHEMEAEAALHHHPIDCARKIDIRRQKYNVLA